MNTVKEEIAKNIKKYRKEKGLTQKDLANMVGVNNSAVSNWESGQNSIDIEILFKVCKALGVNISDIYGEYGRIGFSDYSANEQKIIEAYRAHPEMHSAVARLLDIDE